jgi:hypothetical protein
MINFIFQSIAESVKQEIGADIEFRRVDEKCKPFAPAFLIMANGESTNILFDMTALVDNQSIPITDLVMKIVIGLTQEVLNRISNK